MANYIVTDSQLTAIADAIRAKGKASASSSYGHIGKNLLNPVTLKTPELDVGSYVFSGTISEDLHGGIISVSYYYGTFPEETTLSGNLGDRVGFIIPISASGVVISFDPILGLTDIQYEAGTVATEYEPFKVMLSFPDDFIAAIQDI